MKVKYIIFIILFTGCNHFAICQPPMTIPLNPGDSLRNEGDIKGAIQQYGKLYHLNPCDLHNLYNYTCALSQLGLNDSCYKYLYKYIEMDTSTTILIEPDFLNIRNDQRWNEFENKLISMINIKFNNPYKNIQYAKALWKLSALDQAYFNEIGIAGRKVGMNSSVQRALWKFKYMINKENQKELSDLIGKNGWPKISEVGTEAAEAAFLIIQHSDLDMQKRYIYILKEQCEQKEANWLHYALLYDRIQTTENKPQKYGTQSRYNENTNNLELFPLEDETKVNEWRNEVGLEPLAGYPQKN